MAGLEIIPIEPADHAAVRQTNLEAFGQPEEAGIVERLRAAGEVIAELVAREDGEVVGHILFSRLAVEPPARFAALAPMAVRPGWQRSGVGSALVRAGLDACRAAGEDAVIVVGHPEYYPRFVFSAEAALTVTSPFDGPAFMALALKDGALDRPSTITYPAAFGL